MKKLTAWLLALAMAVTFIPSFAFAAEDVIEAEDVDVTEVEMEAEASAEENVPVADEVREAALVGVNYIYDDDFFDKAYIMLDDLVIYSDITKYIDDVDSEWITYDKASNTLTFIGTKKDADGRTIQNPYQGQYLTLNNMRNVNIVISGDAFLAGLVIMDEDDTNSTASITGDGSLMIYSTNYHGIAAFNANLSIALKKVTVGVEGSKKVKGPLYGIYVDQFNEYKEGTGIEEDAILDLNTTLITLKYGKSYNFNAVSVRTYGGGNPIINLNGKRALNYKHKVQVYDYPKYGMKVSTIGAPGKFDFKKNMETYAAGDMLLVPDLPLSLEQESIEVFCYSDSVMNKLNNANPYYVDWTSSNKKIAAVDDGEIIPKKAGKCTITANYGGEKFKCTVVVKKPVLSETAMSIERGDEADLAVTGGSGIIKWTTSNKKVATVDAEGHITSVGLGTANISAKRNGYTVKCKVTVKAHYPENADVLDFGAYYKKEPVDKTEEGGYVYAKVTKSTADAYIKKMKAEGFTEVLESKVSSKTSFTREFVKAADAGETHLVLSWLNDKATKTMTYTITIK